MGVALEAQQEPEGSSEKWLLDSRQVAGLLGLGRTKVFEMMSRRELPVVQIGRCVRVPREALKNWIEGRTVVTPHSTGSELGGRERR